MAGCPNCGQDIPNVFQGGVLYPPDADNNINLPDPTDNSEWDGVGGNGIEIDDDGVNPPTVEICLNPAADNALEFVNGCLNVPSAASSPEWTSPNTQTVGGITVAPGGAQGHDPSFAVDIAPGSPIQGSFDVNGQLILDPAADVPWQSSNGENIVITSNDNPAGVPGNGHRPTISVREGAALCPPLRFVCTENANGQFTVDILNPTTGVSVPLISTPF